MATCSLGLGSPRCPDARDHLEGQAQREATTCTSPGCRILGEACVPGAASSREGLEPVAPEPARQPAGLVLKPQGPGTRGCVRPGSASSTSPPPSPGAQALLECRRRGGGAAWRLASRYKKLWHRPRAAVQDGCGFEGAAPRGLAQPPPSSAAQASASPLATAPRHSEVRGPSWRGPTSLHRGTERCAARQLCAWWPQGADSRGLGTGWGAQPWGNMGRCIGRAGPQTLGSSGLAVPRAVA